MRQIRNKLCLMHSLFLRGKSRPRRGCPAWINGRDISVKGGKCSGCDLLGGTAIPVEGYVEMIFAIVYDARHEELETITEFIRKIIARHSEEQCVISSFSKKDKAIRAIQSMELADIAILDVHDGTELPIIIRQKFPKLHMLLIADAIQKPDVYIRPSIMASGLLLRPTGKEDIFQTLDEFLMFFLEELGSDRGDAFLIETRNGILKIPYQQISCFEARQKKIIVRLRTEEYGYYGTMDELAEKLPDSFVRCHRSYVINLDRVRSYDATDALLGLDDYSVIPVSRTYRGIIRDVLRDRNAITDTVRK